MSVDIPSPEKVAFDELTPTPDTIPNEESDWASMHSSTRVSIEDDYMFDVSGIAMLSDAFEFDYYVGAGVPIRRVRNMQEDLDWFEHDFSADANGVDESSDGKYSLERRIGALAHTMLTDGHTHALNMVASGDSIRVEYAEHPSQDVYQIQIFWKK